MQEQLKRYQQRCNQQLEQYLDTYTARNEKLQQAIRYSTLEQGKRLRPALVYATGEALGIALEQLDAAACALELIHCYSLVHDDLPAMDDDELRRGKPTCHIAFDEATAILVGDAQQTLAFEILANAHMVAPEARLAMMQQLSREAGARGMVAGQQFDLDAEGHMADLEALKQMHSLKTGALLDCSLHLGALQDPSYPNYRTQLSEFGQLIGLMFQVQDDILDIESDTETLGKPQGSDEINDKSTYPKFLGLAGAKTLRDQLHQHARDTLKNLPICNDFFEDLTQYIVQRKY